MTANVRDYRFLLNRDPLPLLPAYKDAQQVLGTGSEAS